MRLLTKVFLLLLPTLSFGFYDCFFEAGKRYKVDPYLLAAIAKVESNLNPKSINRNKNGSVDYGIMQINSYWINYYKIPTEWLFEPCYNIHFGAMVLRRCMDAHKGDLRLAIDCYNRGARATGESEYVLKVYGLYQRITKR